MAKMKANTLARNPKTGEVEFLAEGSTAPAWAAKQITNPAVLDKSKTAAKGPEDPPAGDGGGTDDGSGDSGSGDEKK